MSFGKRLEELVNEKNTQVELLKFLDIKDNSIFYSWVNETKGISLENAYKIAKFYKCSLDYLFCRTEEPDASNNTKTPNFGKQLKLILNKKKISQYKICKDCKISSSSMFNWTHGNVSPNMSSIIKIADYLNESIDYLIGIE